MKTLLLTFLTVLIFSPSIFSQEKDKKHFSVIVTTQLPAIKIGNDMMIGAGLEYKYNPEAQPEVYSGVIGYVGPGYQSLEVNTGVRTYFNPDTRNLFIEAGGIGMVGFLNKSGAAAGFTTGAGYRFGNDKKYFVKFRTNLIYHGQSTTTVYGFSTGMNF